ncbi:hypothetical protein AAFF_G00215410 [Aldrovandia affinis]|uniref:Relaxin-3 n=1 Tax=Aldrovandia affinis TaxID=143900 RepID=A0AAD7W5K8_9TELE|nr:hypothetical protein AAFF_G00215410 [Aldrovandia affinis]
MWKSVVLAACLLVGGAWATEVQPAYGVKLCGREFIRAVIFTCGGSRWRRAVRSADDLSHGAFSTYHDDAADNWRPDSAPGPSHQQPLETEAPAWPWEGEGGPPFSRPERSPLSADVLEALRSSDRKGRAVVVGLSNACCKWGCSKSEISSLC